MKAAAGSGRLLEVGQAPCPEALPSVIFVAQRSLHAQNLPEMFRAIGAVQKVHHLASLKLNKPKILGGDEQRRRASLREQLPRAGSAAVQTAVGKDPGRLLVSFPARRLITWLCISPDRCLSDRF